MAIKKSELLEKLEGIAPQNLAENWDNSGMQIDCGKENIEKILISLEITDAVIDEAIACKADFILIHHPLIFDKLRAVNCDELVGKYIFKLIQAGITVYSSHTPFDTAYGGNNDYLLTLLELQRIRRMNPIIESEDEEGAMCRMGDLKKPMDLLEVCIFVEEKLKLKNPVRSVSGNSGLIHRVGLCTGAGGEFVELAKNSGCDLFITGDLKHHHALWAKESGICVIDAGHWGTEWIFTPNMASQLKRAVEDMPVEIIESKVDTDPFI